MRDWKKTSPDVPSTRAYDLELLRDAIDMKLDDDVRDAFVDMRVEIVNHRRSGLSGSQRAWVLRELGRDDSENLVSRGLVPRGREVPTAKVLQDLPKKPPGRK